MGGTAILAELIWANYFGRTSLGKIRGMGSLITSVFSAGGPPFFGLMFDATQSYNLSFSIFIGMLFASAGLSLLLPPAEEVAACRNNFTAEMQRFSQIPSRNSPPSDLRATTWSSGYFCRAFQLQAP